MRGFFKKFTSLILVLFLIMLSIPGFAQEEDGDLTEDEINKIAFSTFLKGVLDDLTETDLKALIDLAEKIDQKDIIVSNLFETYLDDRLEGYGITEESVKNFADSIRNDNFDWKEWAKEIAGTIKDSSNTSLTDDQIEWIKHLDNDIFDKKFEGLTKLINAKFNSKFDFLRFNKRVFEDVIKEKVSISYDKGEFSVSFEGDFGDKLNDYLAGEIDDVSGYFKKGQSIAELSEEEISALKTVIENIISAFNESGFTSEEKDLIAKTLENLGFDVDGYPSEEDEEEPGTPGGSGGGAGGGGGGGAVTPSEPEIEVPQDKSKPVAVVVPSDAVDVKVVNGKVTVTFDEELVENLLKLIDEAIEKADGREVVLVIDLAGSDKAAEGAVVELPVEVVAKAFEKDVALTVNFKALGIDIPTGAFDAKDVKTLKLVVEKKDTSDVIKNLKGIEKMKAVGTAFDISLIADEKPVSFKKKVTLRFSIKGLTTNIDKLGVYYIDENEGKPEFVGGKVDRAKAEIRAKLSHLSTYALFEYEKTFTDITNHWAKAYIESMAAKHVVHGRTEQKFVPNDGITRAEFAKLMVTALELDLVPYKGSFEDVKSGAWYADYIQTAYENGIITGRVEGKVFDPDARITRQEIMAMVGRALGRKPVRPVDALLASFKDAAKVAEYAKEHAALLVELGIVSGYPDGTLKPEANTTRAEAVKLIYGLYNNY